MEISFLSKTILVTGAGRGIGKEICKRLYKYQARVIAVSENQKELDQLQEECKRVIPKVLDDQANRKNTRNQLECVRDLNGEKLKGENPNIEVLCCDLSDWNGTREKLQEIGKIDGLVNNAGIAIIKPFEELSQKDFDDTFNVNFKGAFNLTQFLSKNFNDGSSIVNMASLAAIVSIAGHTVYSATKAALNSFTKSLALELAPRKIRVNSVNPTVILTRMGRENWSDPKKAGPLLSRIPLNRFGEVDEVVDVVMYLLSNKSSYINGHYLPVEGGFLAS